MAVYGTVTELTGDARVGVVTVGLLAVTPTHAFRTALGGADHHAFDYLWHALTLYAVVALLARDSHDRRGRRTRPFADLQEFAVAGQALAWEAAPLLLVPLALVVFVELRRGTPKRPAPVVAVLIAAAALVASVHAFLEWMDPAVPVAIAALALGGMGLLWDAVTIDHVDSNWTWLVAVELGVSVVSGLTLDSLPTSGAGSRASCAEARRPRSRASRA